MDQIWVNNEQGLAAGSLRYRQVLDEGKWREITRLLGLRKWVAAQAESKLAPIWETAGETSSAVTAISQEPAKASEYGLL